MRLNLRLLAAIWLPIVVVLGAFAYVAVARERARLTTDLERRAWLLGESLKEAVEPLIERALARRSRGSSSASRSPRAASPSTTGPGRSSRRPPMGAAPARLAGRRRGALRRRAQAGIPVPRGPPSTSTPCPSSPTSGPAACSPSCRTRPRSTREMGAAQQQPMRFLVLVAVLSLVTLVVVRAA